MPIPAMYEVKVATLKILMGMEEKGVQAQRNTVNLCTR